MARCNVCATVLATPVYASSGELSITSLSQTWKGHTQVWACESCGHLQTGELPDVDAYYDQSYRISLASEDDDQLYDVIDGKPVYRTEHQVDTLLRKLSLRHGADVLDYGCAKGAASRRLLATRPDLGIHLFDVSSMYLDFWRGLVPADRWATYEPKPSWGGRFDLVASFYALEHIPRLSEALGRIRSLLRSGGCFYCVVPNVFANPADLIVVDHVNHFTRSSLTQLFARTGFVVDEIDERSHRGALIAIGRPAPDVRKITRDDQSLAETLQRSLAIGRYWNGLRDRVLAFERAVPAVSRGAIYGAGFYGAFLATSLAHPERIACFVDRNPFLQGRELLGKPIVTPEALDPAIDTLYVGLNPMIARDAIAAVTALRARELRTLFLDEPADR